MNPFTWLSEKKRGKDRKRETEVFVSRMYFDRSPDTAACYRVFKFFFFEGKEKAHIHLLCVQNFRFEHVITVESAFNKFPHRNIVFVKKARDSATNSKRKGGRKI